MDDGTAEEMGGAVLNVRRARDVFRDAGWPERFVATVPDVSLGEFIRWIESPGPPPLQPLGLPPQWSVCGSRPMSAEERSRLSDPVENAKAAVKLYAARQEEQVMAGLRYLRERYGEVSRAWETYAGAAEDYRRWALTPPWPLSRPPASPHGDPMRGASAGP